MGDQFNFRLDDQHTKKLREIADKNQTSPSTLAGTIVKKSLDFWEKKRESGNVVQARYIISKYMEMIDDSKIDERIDDMANYILGEMKIEVGDLECHECEQRLMTWNKENSIEFVKFENSDSIKYMSKHDLGERWSEIQCKIYSNILEKMGKTVLDKDYDKVTFCITISDPK